MADDLIGFLIVGVIALAVYYFVIKKGGGSLSSLYPSTPTTPATGGGGGDSDTDEGGSESDAPASGTVPTGSGTTPTAAGKDKYGINKIRPDGPSGYFNDQPAAAGDTEGGNIGQRWKFDPPMAAATNMEFTAFVNLGQINGKGSIHFKLGGGHHSKGVTVPATDACCYDLALEFGGRTGQALRKECPHPNYVKCNINPKFVYNLTQGQWVGVKGLKWNEGQNAHVQYWVETSKQPLGNSWQLYLDWIDTGGCNGGPYLQPRGKTTEQALRISYAQNIQAKYVSLREIQGTNTATANSAILWQHYQAQYAARNSIPFSPSPMQVSLRGYR